MSKAVKMTIVSGNQTVETDSETIKKIADNFKSKGHQLGTAINGTQFMQTEELPKLASKIMKEKSMEFGPARIAFLLVYPNISKKRPAKVKKCSKELKYFTGLDYLIEISGEMWDALDNDTRYTLMWNQLLHIDPQFNEKSQEWKFKVRKPNYSDYYEIHDSEGEEWHKTIQAVTSSLYDMAPRDEDQITLF